MIKKYLLALICALATSTAFAQWNLNFAGVPGYYRMYASHFLNNNVGFIGGGTSLINSNGRISKTSNGGATWTTVLNTPTSTSDITDIYFVNSDLGFSVGDGGLIAKTIDGGNTWTTQNVSDPSNVQGYLNSVYFVDQNVGFVAGHAANDWIMKTTDGGNTWNNLTLPTGSVHKLRRIFFTDLNTGFVVGGEQYGSLNGIVFKTNNGGNTWNPVTTGYDTSAFYSVHFTSSNTGFIGGENGLILKTTDGGQTWVPQPNQDPDPKLIRDFSFINSNLGFACTMGGAILRTTNGGNTWTRDFYLSQAILLFAISVPSQNFGNAVGGGSYYVKMSGLNGIEDLSTDNSIFTIYPNPASGHITLQNVSGKLSDGTIRILNMQGKEVFATMVKGTLTQDLEISNLSNGLYVVYIETKDYSITKKLVVH